MSAKSNNEVIEQMNRILSLEYAGVVQYLQHSFLVSGTDRVVFADFFRDQSKSAHKHATTIGDKIVALGGVPTVEPASIRQATELAEMLQQDLALEKEALAAYTRAWELAEGNFPLRLMLESFIEEEQSHVEDMEKIVNKLTIAVADGEKEIKLQRAS